MDEILQKLVTKNNWMVWDSPAGVWVQLNEKNILRFRNHEELIESLEMLVGMHFRLKYEN